MRTLAPAVMGLVFVLACEARAPVAPSASADSAAVPVTAAEPSEIGDPAVTLQVENLRAFAKVYGYVRHFHPSDEASEVDWTAMAVLGAGMVRDAPTADGLKEALERLFASVAPTMQIYREGEAAPDLSRVSPADTHGLTTVAWQHRGFGGGESQPVYASKRTDRAATGDSDAAFAPILRVVDAGPLRGRRIRLRAALRAEVEGTKGAAQMWLRVERKRGAAGLFDNMDDRPVRASTWTPVEITGPVAEDAEMVVIGGFLAGGGAAFFDEFSLEAIDDQGKVAPVPLKNPGFESGLAEWEATTDTFEYQVVTTGAYRGKKALAIRSRTAEPDKAPLFAAAPKVGEAIDAAIGRGLRVQLPLALYSREGRTYPAPRASLAALQALLAADRQRRPLAYDSLEHRDLRAADVVIAWNILQHFYPYFDLIRADWDEALTQALAAGVTAGDGRAFVRSLQRMVAALEDGHGNVWSQKLQGERKLMPVVLEWIEDSLVIVHSEAPGVERGDVIVSIDGRPAAQLVEEEEAFIAGSPQHRRWYAARKQASGPKDGQAALVLRRGEAEVRAAVPYTADAPPEVPGRPPIERQSDGVFYVDLGRADWPSIQKELPALARAPGVVFDLRGYPNGNHEVLSHLLAGPDTSKAWMRVPEIIHPDHAPPSGWKEYGWEMQPAAPRITGKVAFLTGPGAISYAESVMGLVAHYRLGEIVGAATAGANGNVNPFALPGEIKVVWTGMRVVTHDGGQHHIVGVQPTIPQSRTIAGVRAGRDEVLERGLAVVRGGT